MTSCGQVPVHDTLTLKHHASLLIAHDHIINSWWLLVNALTDHAAFVSMHVVLVSDDPYRKLQTENLKI